MQYDKDLEMIARDTCQTNPVWQASQSAWKAADTDTQLALWWKHGSGTPGVNFATELGKGFGSHLNGFRCGINTQATCGAPGCSEYEDRGDPAWSYQAILSVVNLNQFFNNINEGITTGQVGYLSLVDDLSNKFFPWRPPSFPLEDAAFWIIAIIAAILIIPAALPVIAPFGVILAGGISAFAAAGVQQIVSALEPDLVASQIGRDVGVGEMKKFAEKVGSATRFHVETWANATMRGAIDELNHTIVDYLHDGHFAGFTQSTHEIAEFYKKQMILRIINSQWRREKIFVTFMRTDDANDNSGPLSTRYYSEADGGVYYLYKYKETGHLKGHVESPTDTDYLNTAPYGISGQDITKAAAGAFRVAKFNYTNRIGQDRLVESFTNNTLTPFKDGAGWEGTATIPVCDTGAHNWNVQYGPKTNNQFDWFPCCCGINCEDTKDFIKASNMLDFQTLLKGCELQLALTPDLSFKNVDYGSADNAPKPSAGTATYQEGVPVFALLCLVYMAFGGVVW